MNVEPPKESLDQLKEKISSLNTLIGNKKYVAADHLTIADLSLFSTMGQIKGISAAEKWDLNEFPNLKRWLETLQDQHSELAEIASRMDGLEEWITKLKKNLGVN